MNVISPDDLACGLLNGVLPVYKEWGETPLQTLEKLRVQYPILEDATLSYAGRLDPLAEGLMLVLVGEANKEREKYLGLSKRYEVEILFGIGTDTGDIFGIPTISRTTVNKDMNRFMQDQCALAAENFDKILNYFLGKHHFDYPLYSSKTVQGKPLHQWVNEGRVGEIEIPKTDVEIFYIKNLGTREIHFREILEKVQKALRAVKGVFRFEEIESTWKNIQDKIQNDKTFLILKIECDCSSGTYMRTLAEEIGKQFQAGALAYSIKRTKVGDIEL